MKNFLKTMLIVAFCLFSITAHATIDQDIIDQWGTPTTNNVANNNTSNTSNILNQGNGITDGDLRAGNVDMYTIPKVIVSAISTLLAIAGTVAIFSLIYHAIQMQINSGITGDSSWVDKAKKWMTWALIWFVIAIAAWFLVTRAVDLLAAVS
jgi:hypothetical protein